MTKRMLIDSTHAEETRVVVLDGNRLEDFDVETSTKRQLKGNIYLAKIVRVEPSLQAAFVEYGGNRHGFLAFGEIHPDYYQIPVADRKRLIEAQEREAREEEEEDDEAAEDRAGNGEPDHDEPDDDEPGDDAASGPSMPHAADSSDAPVEAHHAGIEADIEAHSVSAPPHDEPVATESLLETGADMAPETGSAALRIGAETMSADPAPEAHHADPGDHDLPEPEISGHDTVETIAREHDVPRHGDADEVADDVEDVSQIEPAPPPEQIGGEHDTEEHRERRGTPRFLRNYKIQEVIRRRQIMLVQVVKEERGSKGAALTTYISLAGRFCVLMPNSPRGGGISRKITSAADRRRLKEVTAELDLPRGMGLIVRTAGANRPKPEILRDCEYLLNQWDQIRDLTMKSVAPAAIYEEASLIRRAIRDVYSRDVDEILVDGEQGWRAARDFMRLLMPTHARKVQLWKEPQPLFAKAQVEPMLEAMLAPTVQLRSGGYLVINQTEALVAIDVNSGRSTRERGIEETALRTNLEAAEEVARQLRLRDLAGLIVIDFIDMESRRNVGAVERRLKEALKHDRARIQVGSISHFGLLEMSRQRLRPSLVETNFTICSHCGGTGHVRSTESAALYALRAIEEEGGKRRAAEIVVHCPSAVALYILNHKRQRLTEVEARHAMAIAFVADESLLPPALRIERVRAQTALEAPAPIQPLPPPEPFDDPDELEAEAEETEEETNGEAGEDRDSRRPRRRRRRRGRRDDAPEVEAGEPVPVAAESGAEAEPEVEPEVEADTAEASEGPEGEESELDTSPAAVEARERRRRGRRGGRRRRRPTDAEAAPGEPEEAPEPAPVPEAPVYQGPTPANPFAGASAFDIFDVIEAAEERAAAARSQPVTIEKRPPPTGPDLDHEALPAEEADAYVEPEPAAAQAPAPQPPAPEPVIGPAVQPVVIGSDAASSEKKRGWWRR